MRDLASDNTGNLWFVVGLKLYRYNELKDTLPQLISNSNTEISSICILANDELWAATSEGQVQHYDSRANQFTNTDVFNHSRSSPSKWIDDIYDTGKGSLLIATSNQGIKCFDIASRTYKDILTYNGDGTEVYGRDFIHYGGDEYWIATESGIYIYNIRDNSFINLRKNTMTPTPFLTMQYIPSARTKKEEYGQALISEASTITPINTLPFKNSFPIIPFQPLAAMPSARSVKTNMAIFG
nr:WD40 repeat domain-containing protein [Paraflavitalea speifideiaquila]